MFSLNSPPTATEDDLAFLRLIRSRRVGPATFHRLVAEHGGVTQALAALPEIAEKAGVRAYEPCPEGVAAAELKAGRKSGARLIRCDSPDYPSALRQIPDAPPVLWVKGNNRALTRPMLAVIGARNASSLGLRMARGMAGALAEHGICIVAGLARGIDSAAHEASLKTGTIAVMAGGIDVIYPPENRVLAATICDQGCLISEQPPGTQPVARHFPMRNRIISGLSQAVIVVEAAIRSGSLITARNALDQGREVLSVPGHPVDGRAGGCNQLIRDGATLVRNAQDVLDALPGVAEQVPQPGPDPCALPPAVARKIAPARPGVPIPPRTATLRRSEIRSALLSRLSPSPTEENALIRETGIPAPVLAPVILELELAGQLVRSAGGLIALNDAQARQ